MHSEIILFKFFCSVTMEKKKGQKSVNERVNVQILMDDGHMLHE